MEGQICCREVYRYQEHPPLQPLRSQSSLVSPFQEDPFPTTNKKAARWRVDPRRSKHPPAPPALLPPAALTVLLHPLQAQGEALPPARHGGGGSAAAPRGSGAAGGARGGWRERRCRSRPRSPALYCRAVRAAAAGPGGAGGAVLPAPACAHTAPGRSQSGAGGAEKKLCAYIFYIFFPQWGLLR